MKNGKPLLTEKCPMSKPQMSERKRYAHLWPIWVAVGFPLLQIALEASPIAPNFAFVMLGLPVLLLVYAILGLCSAVLAVRLLGELEWKRALICAVLPVAVLCVGLGPLRFIDFCNNAGDTVHFYVRYSYYMNAVRSAPSNGEPKLLTFNLGGMIWASRGFVYDESDQVLLQPSRQSPDWKVRAQESELGCGYGAIPMPGPSRFARHWYIASFPC
jgi:apolipoprotein N-acyltransferase